MSVIQILKAGTLGVDVTYAAIDGGSKQVVAWNDVTAMYLWDGHRVECVVQMDRATAKMLCETGAPLTDEIIKQQADPVNHPPHYTASVNGIECIDAIRAALTPEEFRGFCKGNALKYVWRERHKGGDESLAKAAWYLAKLTEGQS